MQVYYKASARARFVEMNCDSFHLIENSYYLLHLINISDRRLVQTGNLIKLNK